MSFEVEPWLVNLSHYGRLLRRGNRSNGSRGEEDEEDEGWTTHPMTLVGDYEYSLERFYAKGGDEFMFVSILSNNTNDTISSHLNFPPPLGILNWKQGKLGVWGNDRLEPGGGGGRYPVTGMYSISLSTSQSPFTPLALNLVLIDALAVSVKISNDNFLHLTNNNDNNIMNVTIVFGEEIISNFELSHIQATITASSQKEAKGGGEMYLVHLYNQGLSSDGKHTFIVSINTTTINKSSLVTLTMQEGVVNASSGPSEYATWSFYHQPTLDSGLWSPSTRLLDSSQKYLGNFLPSDGWHVTPIHMVMLPRTGEILVSGWLRRDELPCLGGPGPGGRRQASVSFILNPSMLADHPFRMNVSRIEENGQFVFGETNLNTTIDTPSTTANTTTTTIATQEGRPIDGDAIYCAGHTTLRDGRVFYAGGARYAYVSSPYEREYGLDYARLFDPVSRVFTRVNWTMPLGLAWYPTCALLPDGRVLVTGGYSGYATDACVREECLNPQINIFDPFLYDKGQNPWSVYINSTFMTHDIDPGIREYTRIFILPEIIIRENYARDVLVIGKKGIVYLLAVQQSDVIPMNKRMYAPPGGMRPGGGCADQSTAVPLLTSNGGELLIVGGCDGDTSQRIDIYSVQKDSWQSFNSFISRGVPSAFLLPNGHIFLVSGENTNILQSDYVEKDASKDTRYAQIFDPETKQITITSQKSAYFRGYHNTGCVLKDGSVLIGGGINQHGDIGCEMNDVQIYQPNYLFQGNRPLFVSAAFQGVVFTAITTTTTTDMTSTIPTVTSTEPLKLQVGSEIEIVYGAVDVVTNVNLLAIQAFTHSYGQNQRHVKLFIVKSRSNTLTVQLPSSPRLFPGMYWMFLISKQGVPSVGVPIQVIPPVLDTNGPSVHDYIWLVVLLLVLMLMIAAFVVKPIRRKCCGSRTEIEIDADAYTPMMGGVN